MSANKAPTLYGGGWRALLDRSACSVSAVRDPATRCAVLADLTVGHAVDQRPVRPARGEHPATHLLGGHGRRGGVTPGGDRQRRVDELVQQVAVVVVALLGVLVDERWMRGDDRVEGDLHVRPAGSLGGLSVCGEPPAVRLAVERRALPLALGGVRHRDAQRSDHDRSHRLGRRRDAGLRLPVPAGLCARSLHGPVGQCVELLRRRDARARTVRAVGGAHWDTSAAR